MAMMVIASTQATTDQTRYHQNARIIQVWCEYTMVPWVSGRLT